MAFKPKAGGVTVSRDSMGLVLLFLLAGVIVPSAGVLWFMNEAADSQAASARQQVTEAYRGQLRFIRDRVDALWEARAAAPGTRLAATPALSFHENVKAGLADSFVYVTVGGSATYPSLAFPSPSQAVDRRWLQWLDPPELERAQQLEASRDIPAAIAEYGRVARTEPSPRRGSVEATIVARAAQAEIRGLVQSGQKDAALRAIERYFSTGRLNEAADPYGRLITPDEYLLAVQLMKPDDARYQTAVSRLVDLLNDYQHWRLWSAQRLFLMTQVRALDATIRVRLKPDTTDLGGRRSDTKIDDIFPTYEAEKLAAEFLEKDDPRDKSPHLEPSRLPDVWKLRTGDTIALYRTSTVLDTLSAIVEKTSSRQVRFDLIPPGQQSPPDAIAAGRRLPGWQVAFTVLDTKDVDAMARRRSLTYVSLGVSAVTVIAVIGFVAAGAFRRQLRLAQLKTDLVAAVSHELKTPLASMRLLVDVLLGSDEADATKTREYLQLISAENSRLSRVIDNFLTFSRLERHRQAFEFSDTNPSQVVDLAVSAMRERLTSPGCRLDVDVAPNLPPIRADESALVTVLVNLLDNACKYTQGDKQIALGASCEAGRLILAVKDNGIGISAREQKQIFRRFYQVDRRLSRVSGGCGLGLSIVELIVKAHGGSIEVVSEPGRGSTFFVILPLHRLHALREKQSKDPAGVVA